MGSEKITENTTTTAPAKDAPALVKKIGRTTYFCAYSFQQDQQGNHERQNQAYAEK